MARANPTPRPVFMPPIMLDWTDEKLKALGQDELHNLLACGPSTRCSCRRALRRC
jgi:hypothetical protein